MQIRTGDGNGFSESFKIHVLDEVERGVITEAEAKRKYDILGHSTLQKWNRKYGKTVSCIKSKGVCVELTKEEQELMFLRNENKALKKDLEDAKLKNVVWETFADVAEKELGISIRKKFGARQFGLPE
jgi:transposase-like protein